MTALAISPPPPAPAPPPPPATDDGPPTAAAATSPSRPYASPNQIHQFSAPSRLNGDANAPPIRIPVVPSDAAADWLGLADDAQRAMQIHGNAFSWTQCVKECKEAGIEAKRASNPFSKSPLSEVRINLRNPSGSKTAEPHETDLRRGQQSKEVQDAGPNCATGSFVNWAKQEARCNDACCRARWECLMGRLPSCPPPDLEEVDPWPYLSPTPALD
ncbi:hypothetical protein VPH35_067986 [Triticum aestivum]